MKSFLKLMKCARCGREYEPSSGAIRCANHDDGRLDIFYDYEALRDAIKIETLSRRPNGVWKYRELLPINDPKNIVSLGEGGTPFLRAHRFGEKLGLDNLWLLDDTRNPTASFKDRPMTVGVSKAVELGYRTVVSASSGNAAAALSAYSAKAGLRCITFVPEMASIGKLAQLTMYGAHVVKVRGLESGEDPTVIMLKAVCDKNNWYPCPSFGPMNPYQAEGPKTMSYEIVEGLGWEVPNWVFVPVGAGGALAGNWKGYLDFQNLGFIKSMPRMAAVQSTGCAPVIRAYEQGADSKNIVPWEMPDSVATGLMDPYPWDGDAALVAIRNSHGAAVAVSNDEILEAQKKLAKYEGIFAEPSGVTSLAGVIKERENIDKADCVVVEITGSGLKDPNVATKGMPEIPLIDASMQELDRILKL
ncbi:MAG: threonine synthase [Candidatus Bathyarchaeia archaeon]|jgi:threonine synthase